jgi:hypothetical protein
MESERPDPAGQLGASPAQVVVALLVLGVAALAVAVAIGRVGL